MNKDLQPKLPPPADAQVQCPRAPGRTDLGLGKLVSSEVVIGRRSNQLVINEAPWNSYQHVMCWGLELGGLIC